jgi:hypothetical protein
VRAHSIHAFANRYEFLGWKTPDSPNGRTGDPQSDLEKMTGLTGGRTLDAREPEPQPEPRPEQPSHSLSKEEAMVRHIFDMLDESECGVLAYAEVRSLAERTGVFRARSIVEITVPGSCFVAGA